MLESIRLWNKKRMGLEVNSIFMGIIDVIVGDFFLWKSNKRVKRLNSFLKQRELSK